MTETNDSRPQIAIDLDRITHIVELGVNRASLFMGFAFGAAMRPYVTDCSLVAHASVTPKTGKPEDMAVCKEEFKNWIARAAFREVVEAFGLFLDRIAKVCSRMAALKSRFTNAEADKIINEVKNAGLPGKHRKLREQFEVSTRLIEDLISISKARNCLAHDMGIVTTDDVDETGKLVLTWHGAIDLAARDADGKECLLECGTQTPVVLNGPTGLYLKPTQRRKEFKVGETLMFTAQDVGELCNCARLAACEIHVAVMRYARTLGVHVNVKKRHTTG